MSRTPESKTFMADLKGFVGDDEGSGPLFDLGHPLLNRVAHSFLKASGIGALQSVSRQAYFTAVEGGGTERIPDLTAVEKPKHRFPGVKGENYSESLQNLVMNTGKEALQWGLAAGMYSGLTYGMKEATGSHDWKNSALAGAITGATIGMTLEGGSHEQVVQCAITGAALSTAANLLRGLF